MPDHARLPHLRPFQDQPIVFLTAVTHARWPVLANAGAHDILRDLWERSPVIDGWAVGGYVLMPDHVHLFARACVDSKPLSVWIQGWKSLSSRRLSVALRIAPPVWQKDYFDRFLRSADNYSQKWDYVAMNPVRKGLVERTEQWPFKGCLVDLRF